MVIQDSNITIRAPYVNAFGDRATCLIGESLPQLSLELVPEAILRYLFKQDEKVALTKL